MTRPDGRRMAQDGYQPITEGYQPGSGALPLQKGYQRTGAMTTQAQKPPPKGGSAAAKPAAKQPAR